MGFGIEFARNSHARKGTTQKPQRSGNQPGIMRNQGDSDLRRVIALFAVAVMLVLVAWSAGRAQARAAT